MIMFEFCLEIINNVLTLSYIFIVLELSKLFLCLFIFSAFFYVLKQSIKKHEKNVEKKITALVNLFFIYLFSGFFNDVNMWFGVAKGREQLFKSKDLTKASTHDTIKKIIWFLMVKN